MPFELLRREQQDVRTVAAGETIFREGDPGDRMFAVLDGEVVVQKKGRILEHVKSGGVFGEMAIIDHAPRSASAVAHTDCRLAAISERRFLFLVEQTPGFALELMRVLAGRLRRDTAS